MLRLNVRLAVGGLAAMAAGLLGGWALCVALPLQAPALAAALSAEPVPAAQSPAARAMPSPAPAAAPTPAVEAPSPAPSAAAANEAAGKPHLHLDGERSALSYEGESGSLYINKDRLSMRTPFGKFDIDW
jgi:hypothetical protein